MSIFSELLHCAQTQHRILTVVWNKHVRLSQHDQEQWQTSSLSVSLSTKSKF